MALTVLLYWPALHGPLLLDDYTVIANNPALHLKDLAPDSLAQAALSTDTGPLRRPLAMLSFGLNYYFAGPNTAALKLTNLIIHLLTGLVLGWLTHLLLRRLATITGRDAEPRRVWLPWLVMAAWLLHPLNLTPVLYVVQRMTSLSALFTVLAVIGYVLGRDLLIADRPGGVRLMLLSVTGFGLLAVLSKETAVLLPLYLLVIEITFYRFDAAAPRRRGFLAAWTALVALPLAAGLAAIALAPENMLNLSAYLGRGYGPSERLLSEARIVWQYLRLALLPDATVLGLFHDDIAISRGWLQPATTLPAVLGILALLVGAVAARRRLPLVAFGTLWFLAGHSLESTLLPLELFFEHRNYLPMYGVMLAALYYASAWPRNIRQQRIALALIGLYIGLLALVTYARAQDWSDGWRLLRAEVRHHPRSPRAQVGYGMLLHHAGQYPAAREHLERAVQLDALDPAPMLRLIQHHYQAGQRVPAGLWTALDGAMRNGPVHGGTLWTVGQLLTLTAGDAATQQRIAAALAIAVNRPDIARRPALRRQACGLLAAAGRPTGSPPGRDGDAQADNACREIQP